MSREECIEAGIDPRLAGNPFLSDFTWKLVGGATLVAIVLSFFG